MKEKLFIPVLPCGGSSSQNRQPFIKKVQAFLVENDVHRKIYYRHDVNLKAMVYFHYKTEQTKDIDNSLKALFDALKGYLFFDDNQIRDLHARIITASPKAGIEIRLFKV